MNTLSVSQRLAILYLVLPVAVWLIGWFHWWLSLPAVCLIALSLRRPLMGTWKTSPIPTTALLLVVALVFVVVTPAAGIFEVNNFDWDKHRAVFLDLGREDWPVYFNTYYDSPVLLRYYLGYYIVPGLGNWVWQH